MEGPSARGGERLVRRGKEEAEMRWLGNPGQVSEIVNNNKRLKIIIKD